MGWAQLFAAREGSRKLIRGTYDEQFDLMTDPAERSPAAEFHPRLAAAIERHRALVTRTSGEAIAGEAGAGGEIRGFPYASGVGRSRLETLPWEKNRLRPHPDASFAAELDAAIARMDRQDPGPALRQLRALAERDPQNPTIPFWIGRSLRESDRHVEAAAAFGESYRKGLSEAKVLSLWLQALLLGERLEEALETAKEHLPEVVPDAGLWVMLGELKRRSGDRPGALLCADRAAEVARTDSDQNLVSRFRHNLVPEHE